MATCFAQRIAVRVVGSIPAKPIRLLPSNLKFVSVNAYSFQCHMKTVVNFD